MNWIWVPAELTVAYGISSPSETVALLFSTVTISGRASVRVLPSLFSASSARLRFRRLPTMPNAMPAVPAETTPGRIEPIGRFTRLPPFGRPVVALTGRIWPVAPPMFRFGFGSLPPRSLAPMPPVVSVLPTELVKPRPTSTPWLLVATPPPPHWMPSAKRSFRARISMRASIFTCGSGMSSFSRISVLIRSRSAA